MQKRISTIVYVIISLVVLIIIGALFFSYEKVVIPSCDTEACFFEALGTCQEMSYVKFSNLTMAYTILEKQGDSCVVNVKLLRSYWRGNTFESLKGKSMDCYADFGKRVYPDEDLDKCHGPLKEGLQELILQKLQGYILESLAETSNS